MLSKILKSFTFSIFILFCLLIFLELSARFYSKFLINIEEHVDYNLVQKSMTPNLFEKSKNGYIKYIKGPVSVLDVAMTINGQKVYEVTYSIDKYGRRVSPRLVNAKAKFHIAVAGCSWVFGEGVEDNETLPHYISTFSDDINVFNLGKKGGSIADTIAQITYDTTADNLSPQRGILLVHFLGSAHLQRFLTTINNIGTWNKNGAVIQVNPASKKYELKGSVNEVNKLWFYAANFLYASEFLRLIHFDWPLEDDRAYRKYAQAIQDAFWHYQQKYPNSFLIVYTTPNEISSQKIIPFLREQGIRYLDYTSLDLGKYSQDTLYIKSDGHPNALFNKILAEKIYHDLFINSNMLGGDID